MWFDLWLVFRREVAQRVRQPAWLIMGLAQPLLFMFFFGPLLKDYVVHTPGFPPGGTWMIFAPSLMVQMVLVGSSLVGVGLLAEYRSGVLERLRVAPISASSLLLGKVSAVAVYVALQAGLIVLMCHLVFGVRPPLLGLVVSMLIVVVLAVALSSLSYALALRLKSEEGLPAVLNAALLPLLLLSGTFLPITSGLAPPWLYLLSRINPVAHIMEADRAVFRGDFSTHSIILGSVTLVTLAAMSVWFGIRTFVRESE